MTGVAGPASRLAGPPVRVEGVDDLRGDPALDRADADALASALPAGPEKVVFRLPRVLAEQTALEPVAGSDRVFVAEPVPDRAADGAFYARQDRRGSWIPRAEATAYELAEGATLDARRVGSAGSG
ncbi:hypothetical protein [Halorussus sp. AFM4]|uniref:hypothetical protein n=1 Tax=Halorussus sp. AFM4 TaxID=3421651 RepID=UPI003EBAD955